MGECITVHVGQAGLQMGGAVWEVLCLEHGVKQDGSLVSKHSDCQSLYRPRHGMVESRSTTLFTDCLGNSRREPRRASVLKGRKLPSTSSSRVRLPESRHSVTSAASPPLPSPLAGAFFEELRKGKVAARALMLDTDCTIINEFRSGRSRQLYQPSRLLSTWEDTGGVFSSGYFNETLLDSACEEIATMANRCDDLRTFLVFRSTGGGTGSGLASALMLRLVEEFGEKKSIVEINTGPTLQTNTMMSPLVTEAYNAVLATHKSTCGSDCAISVDNTSLHALCRTQLDVEAPSYISLNRLIGQLTSTLTSSLRYEDTYKVYPADLHKVAVPYPRLKHLLPSLGPLLARSTRERDVPWDVDNVTRECFHTGNHLASFDPRIGNYMACALLYRGRVPVEEVETAINKVSELGRFKDHHHPEFVVGICDHPIPLVPFSDLVSSPRSAVLLSNTTALKESWTRLAAVFDRTFQRRGFLHWFTKDGLDVDEFKEARESVASLIQEYDGFDNKVAKNCNLEAQEDDRVDNEMA